MLLRLAPSLLRRCAPRNDEVAEASRPIHPRLSSPRMRAIQYSRGGDFESRRRGVLDSPREPVIGLAEGETRWWGITETGVGRSPPAHFTCIRTRNKTVI